MSYSPGFGMQKSLAGLVFGGLFSTGLMGQFVDFDPSVPNEVYDRTVPTDIVYSVKQVEGESVDLRNLSLSWETVDLRIPGQGGLDIVVSRSHRKVANSPRHIADWHLGIPRVQIPISPWRGHDPYLGTPDMPNFGSYIDPWNGYPNRQTQYNYADLNFTGIINYMQYYSPTVDVNVCNIAGLFVSTVDLAHTHVPSGPYSEAQYNNGPLVLSIPGEGSKALYTPYASLTPVVFPPATIYATNDNWRVECITKAESHSGYGGFEVFSPDGIVYTIDRFAYINPGDYLWGSAAGMVEFQVTEIRDRFGNTITYNYDDGCAIPNCSQLLTDIEASDGRRVYFDYQPDSLDLVSMANETFALLTQVRYVTDTATATEETIVYSYCQTYEWVNNNKTCVSSITLDDWTTNFIESRVNNLTPFLRSVTYANGKRWRYEYSGIKTFSWYFTEHAGLQIGFGYHDYYLGKVELPTGGTIEYQYDVGPDGATLCDYSTRATYCPWFLATDRPFPRLESRTTSGPSVANGLWEYNHDVGFDGNGDPIEGVEVVGPDRRDVYIYHQGLDTWQFLASKGQSIYAPEFPSHPWPADIAFKMGRLVNHEVSDTALSSVLRETDYEYHEPPARGSGLYNGYYPGDNTVLYPLFAETVANNIVVTDYSSGAAREYGTYTPTGQYDLYDMPLQVVESGWDGSVGTAISRTTDYTYAHSGLTAGPWVIGQVDTRTMNGKIIDYDFNANMQVTSVTRYGVTTGYSYNASGDMSGKTWTRDGLFHEVEYNNHHRGIPQQEIHPVDPNDSNKDIIIHRNVDDLGRIVWEEDGRGVRTNYDYDETGLLTQIDYPVQIALDVDYVLDGTTGFLDELVVTQGNYEKKTHLDGFGRKRVVIETDAGYPGEYPRANAYTYDSAGRVATESAPFEYTGAGSEVSAPKVSFTYDEFDRVIESVGVNGTDTSVWCYRQSCNTGDYASHVDNTLLNGAVLTNARGFEVGYEYRAFGHPENRELMRIAQQTASAPDPVDFIVTTIERDDFGNITKVEQGNGSGTDVERTYQYTPELFLWRVTNPETGVTEYDYDEVGNRISSQVGASDITTYAYDGRNRLTDIIYPDPTPLDPNDPKPAPDVHYEYDPDGRVTSVGHDDLNWEYDYNGDGLVTLELLTVDTLQYFMENEYNNLGNLLGIIYPAGNHIRFGTDRFGRARRVRDITTSVDHVDNVKYWPDNTVREMTFNNGQVYQTTRTDRLLPETLITANGGPASFSLLYEYDAAANPIDIDDLVTSSESKALGYDGADRLVTADGPWGAGGIIEYDRIGNITRKAVGSTDVTYNYDTSNRLHYTTATGTSWPYFDAFTYDDYGNVASNFVTNAAYIYNAASEMLEVTGLPYQLKFRYDGNGKRAVTRRDSDTTYHGYNQAGKLMYSLTCTETEGAEQFYYLGNMLVARETMPCEQGCHPSQE